MLMKPISLEESLLLIKYCSRSCFLLSFDTFFLSIDIDTGERTPKSFNLASSFARNCAILPNFVVFKALHLTMDHLVLNLGVYSRFSSMAINECNKRVKLSCSNEEHAW